MAKQQSKYGQARVDHVEKWTDSAGQFLPVNTFKMVICSHTKRYHNCLYLLAGLSSCARDVMDFITEDMDNDNIVSTNEHFRTKFMEFIAKTTAGQKPPVSYAESSVKRALRDLTTKGLIRQMKRGYSKVNPEFFFKNDDKRRMEAVKLELEFRNGSDTQLKIFQERHSVPNVRNDIVGEPDVEYKPKEKE